MWCDCGAIAREYLWNFMFYLSLEVVIDFHHSGTMWSMRLGQYFEERSWSEMCVWCWHLGNILNLVIGNICKEINLESFLNLKFSLLSLVQTTNKKIKYKKKKKENQIQS